MWSHCPLERIDRETCLLWIFGMLKIDADGERTHSFPNNKYHQQPCMESIRSIYLSQSCCLFTLLSIMYYIWGLCFAAAPIHSLLSCQEIHFTNRTSSIHPRTILNKKIFFQPAALFPFFFLFWFLLDTEKRDTINYSFGPLIWWIVDVNSRRCLMRKRPRGIVGMSSPSSLALP